MAVEVRCSEAPDGLMGDLVRLAGCYLEVFTDQWHPELVYGPNDRRWHRFIGDQVCEDVELVLRDSFDGGWLSVQIRDDEDNLLAEKDFAGPLSLSPWHDAPHLELRHTVWSDAGAHQEALCYLDHQIDAWRVNADAWPEAARKNGRLVFAASRIESRSLPFTAPVRGRLSPLARPSSVRRLGASV